MSTRSGLVILAVAVLAIPACKSASVGATSTIEITPKATSVEVDASVPTTYTIRVTNTGQGRTLNIASIVPEYTPPAGVTETTPAFELRANGLPAQVAPSGEGTGTEFYDFDVVFTPQDDSQTRTFVVTVVNDNSTDLARQQLRIGFTTRLCEAAILGPSTVDFELVTLETASKTEEVQLTNTGSCKLMIDWLMLEGSAGFSLDVGGRVIQATEMAEAIPMNPSLTIDDNSSTTWSATFAPTDCQPARATLTIHSNEAGVTDGKRQIELVGNSTGPRIEIVPPSVEFGGKKIGKAAGVTVEIRSVGTQPLVITGLAIKTDASPDFAIDYSTFPGGAAPTDASPLTLDVNQSLTFLVTFTPDVKNPEDPSGDVSLDKGAIEIASNSCYVTSLIALSGYGVEVDCPQPVIVIEEGEDARPQDIIHLHGEQSVAASGSIQKYAWTVEQPEDNKFALMPAANYPTPTHEVNIGGLYTYCLDVCDADFCSSDPQCKTTACKSVTVTPDEAIHCELTWNTPGDPDQFNAGPDEGSDMDLHFLHPFATGPDLDGDGAPDGWFDIPYDVFWYNRTPEWESVNPNVLDNPSLDRDDTDGAGPENVNLRAPVNGRTYRVGVHYWDDHGFGFSYPRLKCYVWGQLVFDRDLEAMGQKMFKCDMWEAATIKWPSGMVSAVQNQDGSLKITSNYMNSAFVVVGGSSCGQP